MAVVSCITLSYCTGMSQNITDLQWKNRVVLLVAPSLSNTDLKKQLTVFDSNFKAFKERDLVYFIITPKAIYNQAKKEIDLEGLEPYQKASFKGVILLGKDGGIKLKEPYPVASETLMALIDAMPMRRSEIKSKHHQ